MNQDEELHGESSSVGVVRSQGNIPSKREASVEEHKPQEHVQQPLLGNAPSSSSDEPAPMPCQQKHNDTYSKIVGNLQKPQQMSKRMMKRISQKDLDDLKRDIKTNPELHTFLRHWMVERNVQFTSIKNALAAEEQYLSSLFPRESSNSVDHMNVDSGSRPLDLLEDRKLDMLEDLKVKLTMLRTKHEHKELKAEMSDDGNEILEKLIQPSLEACEAAFQRYVALHEEDKKREVEATRLQSTMNKLSIIVNFLTD